MRLGEATWPDVDSRSPATVVVPLGSLEQHGPHLPLDTDTRIAVAVADRAAHGLDGVAVAPALTFGASGEHQDFAGTISVGTEALSLVLVELVRSARRTFARTVLVNGHGGNHDAVDAAVGRLRTEGHDVVAWWPRVAGGDLHAGRTETSMLLALAPELVRLDQARAGTAPGPDLLDDLRRDGVRAHAPSGVLGDPTGASAAEGERILTALAADLRALLLG